MRLSGGYSPLRFLESLQFLVLTIAVVAALLAGFFVALNPFASTALLALIALVVALVRFDLVPSRPLEFVIMAVIIFLPLTPFISTVSPASSEEAENAPAKSSEVPL